MADRFIALNVGAGDAFFLTRADRNVLVDGGPKKAHVEDLLSNVASTSRLDVVVCTHNDGDHAAGILRLFRSQVEVGECWLPATWLEALVPTLLNREEALLRLLRSIDTEGEESVPRPNRDGELTSVDEVNRLLAREVHRRPGSSCVMRGVGPGVGTFKKLWHGAANIYEIAVSAMARRVPIRWFDPESAPAQQPTKDLHVVNAAEVTFIRRSQLGYADVIRLTQANRDALVLYSPPSDDAPGVLFSSDSGFGFASGLPDDAGMLVTVPHHGSDDSENLCAYDRLEELTTHASFTWVRSDGANAAYRSRPCERFLEREARYCTNCRGQPSCQHVEFAGKNNVWCPVTDVTACRCVKRTPPDQVASSVRARLSRRMLRRQAKKMEWGA